ncbi:MAG: ribonuclease III [Candidatus Marinimicrobia bacterium]|nr:ribonuclease III [Candidatus Neomarinimicrobiota bacterium]|tara:strand:+ start:4019 stop:4669 length:651 start_codon:yes stop_codon:yes gene_type:complete
MKKIEDSINYTFKNKEILKQALTHPSYSSDQMKNYQRLEFLGDAILNFVVTNSLFNKYKKNSEGELSKQRASIINYKTLSKVSKKININKYITTGKSLQNLNDKIISDCYESTIGAITLDSDINQAKKFIETTLLDNIDLYRTEMNYKGQLIEFCNKIKSSKPFFKTQKEINNIFSTVITIKSLNKSYKSNGVSKKESEKKASRRALIYLNKKFIF